MITLISESGDQKLSILDYDESRTNNVRYKAVISDDQVAVLHLQSVDTKDPHHDLSQLSLCPGVLESEVLQILSHSPVSNTLVCVMFLIEKLQKEIVYRSRSCQLLYDRSPYQGICSFCYELLNDLKTNAEANRDLEYQQQIEACDEEPPDFFRNEEFEAKAEPTADEEVKPVVIKIMKEEAVKESQSDEEDNRDQDEDYVVSQPVKAGKSKKSSHDWPTQKKKSFSCPECPRRFVSQKFLLNHADKHHGLQLTPAPAPAVSEYELMKCPFCDEMLRKYPKVDKKRKKKPQKLSIRVRSHLLCFHPDQRNTPTFLEIMEQFEVKEFICTDCGKCLFSNQSLEAHMVQSHASHLNTIPCHLCGKFLKNKYLLQSHIRNIHERANINNNVCEECGKTFGGKAILKRHIERVHSDQTFKCKECGKELQAQDALMKHVRLYHSGREPKPCPHPQCEKSFFEERNLQKHISHVHDKLKPFNCDVCPFQCSRLSNLNLHRRKSHNRHDKLTKTLLISMVENDQHPFYTRDDLPMIRKQNCY